jgi:hypothetical protein
MHYEHRLIGVVIIKTIISPKTLLYFFFAIYHPGRSFDVSFFNKFNMGKFISRLTWPYITISAEEIV